MVVVFVVVLAIVSQSWWREMVVELSVVIVSVIFVKVIGFSIEFAGIFSPVDPLAMLNFLVRLL